MARFFPVAALAALLVTTAISARAEEPPASGTAQSTLATEVVPLLAAHPDGGQELEDALAALVAAQPDPAVAVSELIALLGTRPSAGQIAAAGNAIRRSAKYSVAALQKAIAELIVSADDPVTMARNTVAVAPYLDDAGQAAIGTALARAMTAFRENGKASIAGVIDLEIATAVDSPLQRAYVAERGEPIQTGTPRLRDNAVKPFIAPKDFEPQRAASPS
ncbi:MAG TPA: hypothetical protein VGN05_03060 [Parvibaculum sp.]|jgi:hypothetical protein